MTSGTGRGHRKRKSETRYPEPSRGIKPTLPSLTFKAHLCQPKPAFLGSSPSAFFPKQASHTSGPLLTQVLLPGPSSPTPRSGSLLRKPSRTPQQRASFLLGSPTAPPSRGFPRWLQGVGWGNFQLWLSHKWLEGVGGGGSGGTARRLL